MDNNSSVPSFELPKNAEQDPGVAHNAEKDAVKPEVNREILPAPVQSMPTMTPSGTPDPATAQTTIVQTPGQSGDDSHLIADDSDVIEKEWVERAKKIIAATSSDPYFEAQELSKLKASYMRKRFNKDIPLAGDVGK